MIEAVGYEYFDTFFRVCSERLKDDGLMCLQAITIADRVFDRFRRSHDFIRSHVFPGSCLTSLASMSASLARVTDLRLIHLEDITPHYARTLRLWRERFFANLDQVRALGYSETLSVCGNFICAIVRVVLLRSTLTTCNCSWPSPAIGSHSNLRTW